MLLIGTKAIHETKGKTHLSPLALLALQTAFILLYNQYMAYLALVRHGESEWNIKGVWTGWTDVELSPKGHEEARLAGEALKDIQFDLAYTSTLKRAKETFVEIQK